MKKILNGKLYNTDTAHEVGSNSSSYSSGDFRHWCETLFCKRTGEYFLYGNGGPMTKYRCQVGDIWCGGDGITPMTIAEAKQWAEENLSVDEYETEFGVIVDDENENKDIIKIQGEDISKYMSPEQFKVLTDCLKAVCKSINSDKA